MSLASAWLEDFRTWVDGLLGDRLSAALAQVKAAVARGTVAQDGQAAGRELASAKEAARQVCAAPAGAAVRSRSGHAAGGDPGIPGGGRAPPCRPRREGAQRPARGHLDGARCRARAGERVGGTAVGKRSVVGAVE
jgi:hypothetical protein